MYSKKYWKILSIDKSISCFSPSPCWVAYLPKGKGNQLTNNRRFFSTKPLLDDNYNNIDPYFITGITDAEGSFVCIIRKNSNSRLGWRVEVIFQIALHRKDLELLKLIKAYFDNTGIITESELMCAFRVSSPLQILGQVLSHFDKYPLITQKHAYYLLFKKIVEMVLNKKHLNEEGLQEIINIRACLNLGLSHVLKESFPNTTPVLRPLVNNKKIPDPQWVAGFVSGEGCFFVKITKDRNIAEVGVQILFQVSQHERDIELLKSFIYFFNCGSYVQSPNRKWGYYVCTKFKDNFEIIKAFFDKYPIRGVKYKDYLDWIKIGKMINKKQHLTKQGITKIILIKSNMNTKRLFDNKD